MQSFLQGSLWGLVVGGVGLSFVSLVNEQPVFASGPPAPQLAAPQLETVQETPSVALQASEEDSPTFTPAPPLNTLPELSDATPQVATESADPPQTTEVATAIETPQDAADPMLDGTVDAPIAGTDEAALATAMPESAAPSVPAAPLVVTSDDTQAATSVQDTDAPEVTVIELGTPRADNAALDDASTEPLIVITQVEPEEAETSQPDEVVAEDAATPAEAPAQEEVVADAPAEETLEPAPSRDAASIVEDPTPTPQVAETGPPATVTPELPQTNAAVRINRPGADTDEVPEDTTDEDALPDDAPALLRFAAAFENPDDLPLISVILIDTGAVDAAPAALSELGFVPTVVINALAADAADAMAAYRAAGIEVAMQADLPDAAQPVDVEVAFEAAFAQLPEVAMLFSNGVGALQNRDVTAQIMEILAADGRGFVTVQQGLGNAARTAQQEGIAAATILRDLDGAGEDSRAITRALDQAAFRARQSGDAILLGRLTPQTVDALREWAADVDRETLAIAPVSAVLLKQAQ